MLQTFLATEELNTLPSASDLDAFMPYLVTIGVAMGIVLVLVIVLNVIRAKRKAQGNFDHVTLLISLPKFKRAEDAAEGSTKEKVQEAIAAAENFFAAVGGGMKAQHGFGTWLSGRTDEMAFEIVAQKKTVSLYVTVPKPLKSFIEQQLSAAYHDAYFEEVEDYNIFSPTGVILGAYIDFKREPVFPIKSFRQHEKDTLNGLTNAISKIPDDEGAAFQFVVRSAPDAWRNQGIRIARNMQSGMSIEEAIKGKKSQGIAQLSGIQKKNEEPEKERKLSPLEDQTVKGLEEKASKAGMEVCVRLVVSGKDAHAAETTLSSMMAAFAQFNIYEYGNSFVKAVPRSKNGLVQGFIRRTFDEGHRLILNAEEMATVWHLPTPWTETPNIHWLGARKAPAPANVPNSADGQVELGFNEYRGVKTPVWIKQADRQRHMYIMGKSGSGKSELIGKLAIQDIVAGRGVAVVDPHGDLIDRILANIPRERVDDVIYFCPADTDRPMGLNMLESKDPAMRDFAVQEMISIFYKLFPPEMIGPMFEHNMRNFMLTLMSDTENPGTIAEVPRMITDDAFQKQWLAKVTDPVVRSFWENEIAKTSDFHKSEMFGYLTSKVGRFVENEMMRNIIGQAKSSFDFREVMDQQKILLVNLSKGRTGDVNAELLGLIIVSKLQMAALGRANMPEADRKDFYLYIDEFQNFITDSIATILSEARKYRLDLIIAHQYTSQLVKNNDTKIRDAVFGNVGTMMVARIGPEDVETFEKIYSPYFAGYDLQNSDKFTWFTKMIVDNASTKPFTMGFNPPPKGDVEIAEAIKELSRLKYGRDKAIVEAEIQERTTINVAPAVE